MQNTKSTRTIINYTTFESNEEFNKWQTEGEPKKDSSGSTSAYGNGDWS